MRKLAAIRAEIAWLNEPGVWAMVGPIEHAARMNDAQRLLHAYTTVAYSEYSDSWYIDCMPTLTRARFGVICAYIKHETSNSVIKTRIM